MKKWRYPGIIILVGFILLFGNCSKEDDEKGEPAPKAQMQAVIDGIFWEATVPTCIILDSIASVRTKCTELPDIVITFYDFEEGSYDLSASGNCFATLSHEDGTFTTLGGGQSGGELTITSIDTETSKIAGNFEFVALNVLTDELITVSGGSFTDITYLYVTSPGINNKLQAVIDGENFNASEVETVMYQDRMHLVSFESATGLKLNISFPDDISQGTYEFNNISIKGTFIKDDNREFNANPGILEIMKHDTVKEILSGYFSFKAIDETSGDSISLTNGNFYIRY